MSSPAVAPNPALARGILQDIVPATATKPGYIVFALPGSSYQLHLQPVGEVDAVTGKRIAGYITCKARRVDATFQGGRFIEPLYGRPRRVQGVVTAVDGERNTLVVNAAGAAAVDGPSLPVVLQLTDPRQDARQFTVGTLVGCDVLDGATFTPGN